MDRFFTDPRVIESFQGGALGAHVSRFAQHFFEQGHTRQYGRKQLRPLRELSRWLKRQGLGARDLDEEMLAEFARECRRRRRPLRGGNRKTLADFLKSLREIGASPSPLPKLARDAKSRLEREFAEYLVRERGLCEVTVYGYLRAVCRFLADRCTRGALAPSQITAKDLNAFVLRSAQKAGRERAKRAVTALRSFCQFLRFQGVLKRDLSTAVLAVASWRLASLPKSLVPSEVRQLLRQCDQRTAAGQRDFTMLLVLARLGLRAKEILQMRVDDIDWEAGEFMVRGKGLRHDRMPLPHDVGVAIAAYLRRGRPRCTSRRLFVRLHAPFDGLKGSGSVGSIVKRALTRAGLHPPTHGAHLLRYTCATNLLRQGGSLAEVAEVLRHRHLDTTALYAKVDLNALRSVAPRWPGVRT